VAYLSRVALTLNNLGNLLCDLREFGAARTAFEEGLGSSASWRRADLRPICLGGVALNNLGVMLCDLRS